MTATTVFPAAAQPADDRHPDGCACQACTDVLLARLSRPLVQPGPRTDPALTGTEQDPDGARWA